MNLTPAFAAITSLGPPEEPLLHPRDPRDEKEGAVVYRDGFAFRYRRHPLRAWRWEQVAEIYVERNRFRFVMDDGTEIEAGSLNLHHGWDQLGARVFLATRPIIARRIVEAYNAGRCVGFGKDMTLGIDGLQLRLERHPWSDVGIADVTNRRDLRLFRPAPHPRMPHGGMLFNTRMHWVPNLQILLELFADVGVRVMR